MAASIDNLIAFKVLSMLVQPFEKTDAYELGIIDKDGKALKKVKDFKTSEEKDSYTALHRLVFNLKKLLAKVPGGSSTLGSLIAAYWLIKESEGRRITEDELLETIRLIESKNISLVEEEIEVRRFLEQIEEDGVIANVTGAGVATDYPAIKPKKKKKTLQMFRRKDIENVRSS